MKGVFSFRAAAAVAPVLFICACSTGPGEPTGTKDPSAKEAATARVQQALDCIDPNDPNTCIDCSADFCPSGYICHLTYGLCVSHCHDGVRNGDEGGVDCGGSCDVKCASGSTCYTNWDCASGVCNATSHCN